MTGVDAVSDLECPYGTLFATSTPPTRIGPFRMPIEGSCVRCARRIDADDYAFAVDISRWSSGAVHVMAECLGCSEGRGVVCEHANELRSCPTCCPSDPRVDDRDPLADLPGLFT